MFGAQLVQSRQMGARAAFTEIQTRHQDLRKIEETIAELGQMMQDVSLIISVTRILTHSVWIQMATLVLEQDEAVIAIEENAVAAEGDMGEGWGTNSFSNKRQRHWSTLGFHRLQQTQKAVKSARSARQKR
jgi:syntaxin 1B/2/3